MFDENKKNELIKKIQEQPKENGYYVIYTLKRHFKNLIQIKDKMIFAATAHSDNFKKFEDVKIELANNVVFIGPNNSGKTTALQALLACPQNIYHFLVET